MYLKTLAIPCTSTVQLYTSNLFFKKFCMPVHVELNNAYIV